MAQSTYIAEPESIKQVLEYVCSHENVDIKIKEFVDEVGGNVLTPIIKDIGYCFKEGFICFCEDRCEINMHTKIIVIKDDRIMNNSFVARGPYYQKIIKQLYEEDRVIQILVTYKGLNYLKNYKIERFIFWSFPLILILVFIILAAIAVSL